MEVLNRNQRRSAIWRLAALGAIIVAILAMTVFCTRGNYADGYAQKYEGRIRELENENQKLLAQKQDLQNKQKALQKEINELKEQIKDPGAEITLLQGRLQACQDQVGYLDQELQRKQTALDNCLARSSE